METNVTIFDGALMLATLFCSLVAGFLFAFAAVVMPGIRRLDDDAFIRVFQAIDGVIQNGSKLFVVVWMGSVLTVMTTAILALLRLGGTDRMLVLAAALVYLLDVQLPTFAVNIPLNNRLQKLESASMSETARKRAREDFERRWNRWNVLRTVCATATIAALLVTLVLLRVGAA